MTSKSLRGIPDVYGIPRESIRAPCKIHLGGSFLGKNITLVKPGRILPPNSQGKKMLYSYCLASALSGDNMCQSESRLIFTACISSNCLVLFRDAVADHDCSLHQATVSMSPRPPHTLSPLLQCRHVTHPHHPQGPSKFRSSIFMSCESSSKWEMYPLRDNTNIAHQRVGHRIFTILEKRHGKNLFRCFLNSQITLPSDKSWLVL